MDREKSLLSVKKLLRDLARVGTALFTGDQSREWWRTFLDGRLPRCMATLDQIVRMPMNDEHRSLIEEAARRVVDHVKQARGILGGGGAPPRKPTGEEVGEAIQRLTAVLARLVDDPEFANGKTIGS